MFRVPSTPDSRRASQIEGPSTTPAGPPPTNYTSQSFTPAGPPPSSVFGSSFAGSTNQLSKPAFAPSGHFNGPTAKAPLHTNPLGAGRPFENVRKGFAVPSSSPPQHYDDEMEEEGEDDEYSDEDAEGTEEDAEMDTDGRNYGPQSPVMLSRERSETPSDIYNYADIPRGSKRSRNGDVMGTSVRSSRVGVSHGSRKATIPGIARGLATSMSAKKSIDESDDIVLQTEQVLGRLDDAVKARDDGDLDAIVTHAVKDLTTSWSQSVRKESLAGTIGPQQKQNFTRANYLASLLFLLHHPVATTALTAPQQASFPTSARFGTLVTKDSPAVTVPKAMLEWLNTYHNPYPEDLPEVLRCKPSPSAHERFWDLVYSTQLRGDFATTIRLLETAGFAHADSALEDGYDEPGYRGRQLAAVQDVVGRCIEVLKSCPVVTDGDWQVTNTSWALFRNRVRRALSDLEAFAEDDSEDRAGNTNIFQASTNSMSLSTASRRAESKVPWSIYEQLKAVYGQLQGLREEILLSAQDWLEATIYLTVWWDGQGDEDQDLTTSRRSLRYAPHTRQVDITPLVAYRKRLNLAFANVTDEPEDPVLGVNTVDPIQVGLACICEDDVEGVIGLLRGWSMPLAAAVVDIASAAGWLPQGRPRSRGLMDGFDQDDLMVLSHGQGQQRDKGLVRDDFLSEYADSLSQKEGFEGHDGKATREGWELAVRVLSRLDSNEATERKVGQLFDKVPIDSKDQVDKVLAVCNELGLDQHVREISERYANNLTENSRSYGEAIIYYARARSVQQLQSTMDLLISMSLVRSAAYPASDALDAELESLLSEKRLALHELSYVDQEAATLIATHVSGYASLRRFYELRDEGEEEDESKKSGLRPLARKREAAKAVTALIESSADSIRGGLLDVEVQGVVQTDALLALLGEALPLMDQPKTLLKPSQLITILRGVEDLQTVTSRVYDQAEALFQAAMADYHGTKASSPQDLSKNLSKSVSNLSASSYGMINSQGSIISASDGASQEDIKRGWDWRKGIALMSGKKAKGSDVLRVLRVQIAKELARSMAVRETKAF